MPHKEIESLLEGNRAWVERVRNSDPEFFTRSALGQSPKHLWIGCSDARVPANEVISRRAGEVFVHRNVANLVVASDLNVTAVMQFAIDVLRVEHVLVCGHYGCGGVLAALGNQRHGLVDIWLRHVRDLVEQYSDRLEKIADETERARALVEINALTQARNVARTTVLRDAWAREQPVHVHALVYGLEDGILQDLGAPLTADADIEAVTRAAIERCFTSRSA